ncbi:hypothetical protein GDO78_018851 [Eleutherodactylus coqui]|uniref:TIL domain-containing protein n=1 Tax=Eleutherodactylus coqui TaxID=57060 RepID=A0A8J6BK15_ELECQ|nr:hypothetical protein GDO78_018851 [Eleutherodactylus coqui]
MGFLTLNMVFLVAILLQQIDRCSLQGLKCPPNSSPGSVTDCDRTCGNADVDKFPPDCDKTSKPGCKCDYGLFAQTGTSGESVECVKPEECKVECGPNKYYDSQATSCQATCEHPDLPKVCRGIPRPGCVCEKEYIRSEKDNYACIEKCKCKPPVTKS